MTNPHAKKIRDVVNWFIELSKKHGNTKISTWNKEIETCANGLYDEFLLYAKEKNDAITTLKEKHQQEITDLKQTLESVKAQKFDEITELFSKQAVKPPNRGTAPKPGMSTNRSYAQAASGSESVSASKPVKTNHVVVIKPKDTMEDTVGNSDVTYKVFKSTVSHQTLIEKKIQIKSRKLTSKKRVVLSCGSEDQCKALCGLLAQNSVIQATVPQKKNPQIQILGVETTISKEEIFSAIISQNGDDLEEFSNCKFEIKFEKADRRGTKFVVAEVEPKLFKKLMELRRVCLGYSSCPIKDRIRVMRCYKCNQFGHGQNVCRNESICAACAGPHETKACTETGAGVNCSNCKWVNEQRTKRHQALIDANHRADDHACPQYQRMARIVENQFDFG